MSNDTVDAQILLVEDEALIAMAEAHMLEKQGFSVKTVLNGTDAIREGIKNEIDLILMDIDLGRNRMDGTEASKKILEQRDVPIIFLTSHSEKEYVSRVKGITQYGYILKNSGVFVLFQAIEKALKLFNKT
ncbi:response regulator [Sediminispirochaeta smaragdinae]|uniref:Response regulator receiver protein n=1 Tax=Sediminispirochaeta smaragdinae (strain DSM 11293 / JCM 15392 / SEBR 4228) TaxID=573413 RepID=E1R346_SEDSS|nr:response regulator [Sediminispirochaeta smaragdinae]ADK81232.1 response regulator receiver protein [Sediminispirochaeta smaragdinae DSM 11293]